LKKIEKVLSVPFSAIIFLFRKRDIASFLLSKISVEVYCLFAVFEKVEFSVTVWENIFVLK